MENAQAEQPRISAEDANRIVDRFEQARQAIVPQGMTISGAHRPAEERQ